MIAFTNASTVLSGSFTAAGGAINVTGLTPTINPNDGVVCVLNLEVFGNAGQAVTGPNGIVSGAQASGSITVPTDYLNIFQWTFKGSFFLSTDLTFHVGAGNSCNYTLQIFVFSGMALNGSADVYNWVVDRYDFPAVGVPIRSLTLYSSVPLLQRTLTWGNVLQGFTALYTLFWGENGDMMIFIAANPPNTNTVGSSGTVVTNVSFMYASYEILPGLQGTRQELLQNSNNDWYFIGQFTSPDHVTSGFNVWKSTDLSTYTANIDTSNATHLPGQGTWIKPAATPTFAEVQPGGNAGLAITSTDQGSTWSAIAGYPAVLNEEFVYQNPGVVQPTPPPTTGPVPPPPPPPGPPTQGTPQTGPVTGMASNLAACAAVVLDLVNNNVFLAPMIFNWDNITCCTTVNEAASVDWSNWVPTYTNWITVPYVSWSSIPNLNDESMYFGTVQGYVMRLFGSLSDNQKAINFNATWGLRGAQQLTQNMKVSWIECYLNAIPNALGTGTLFNNEAMEADVTGFIQPLDASPTQITSLAIALADQSTFYSMIEPGPTNPANLPLNWIQFTMQGEGNPAGGNFNLAGATIYVNLDDKPDYQSVGGIATR